MIQQEGSAEQAWAIAKNVAILVKAAVDEMQRRGISDEVIAANGPYLVEKALEFLALKAKAH